MYRQYQSQGPQAHEVLGALVAAEVAWAAMESNVQALAASETA